MSQTEVIPSQSLLGTFWLAKSWSVLGLYRKRDEARGVCELGVIARFRYNDLKEAARDLRRTRALCKFNGGKERRRACRRCAAERDT